MMSLVCRLILPPRRQNEEIRSSSYRTYKFLVGCLNGGRALHFLGRRVLDHLGLTPYLHSITLLIMMGLMAGIIKLV